MDREETIKKLHEVQAMNLSHMSYAKYKEYYGNISGFEKTDENIKIIDEYFNKFLDPKNDYISNGCWLCGNKDISTQWGLAHGVAYSNCCGLEYVVYHYPNNICKDKKLFENRLTVSLQYHPDSFNIEDDSEE